MNIEWVPDELPVHTLVVGGLYSHGPYYLWVREPGTALLFINDEVNRITMQGLSISGHWMGYDNLVGVYPTLNDAAVRMNINIDPQRLRRFG